jgi:hypothetical protein
LSEEGCEHAAPRAEVDVWAVWAGQPRRGFSPLMSTRTCDQPSVALSPLAPSRLSAPTLASFPTKASSYTTPPPPCLPVTTTRPGRPSSPTRSRTRSSHSCPAATRPRLRPGSGRRGRTASQTSSASPAPSSRSGLRPAASAAHLARVAATSSPTTDGRLILPLAAPQRPRRRAAAAAVRHPAAGLVSVLLCYLDCQPAAASVGRPGQPHPRAQEGRLGHQRRAQGVVRQRAHVARLPLDRRPPG